MKLPTRFFLRTGIAGIVLLCGAFIPVKSSVTASPVSGVTAIIKYKQNLFSFLLYGNAMSCGNKRITGFTEATAFYYKSSAGLTDEVSKVTYSPRYNGSFSNMNNFFVNGEFHYRDFVDCAKSANPECAEALKRGEKKHSESIENLFKEGNNLYSEFFGK